MKLLPSVQSARLGSDHATGKVRVRSEHKEMLNPVIQVFLGLAILVSPSLILAAVVKNI